MSGAPTIACRFPQRSPHVLTFEPNGSHDITWLQQRWCPMSEDATADKTTAYIITAVAGVPAGCWTRKACRCGVLMTPCLHAIGWILTDLILWC